jgi:hypothetical protein
MNNPLAEISNQINKLKADLLNMKNQEFSKVVALTTHVRLLDDTTPRTAPYNPANLTVTSFGGLPAKITAIWYQIFISAGAAGAVQLSIGCPDGTIAVRLSYTAAAINSTGTVGGFVKLGASAGASPGQLGYSLSTGSYNRLVIDVVGYEI